ncbi:hypothetical protein GCM10017764_28590 [Sphingobacterium griseoflavum]|uniref:Uncharacterized protein n=1 Tax=Sphingobacterium griseoflavum TaxID=1474952 RepID=A0ABQ3HZR1_9SPHI|nr:hypothetical protein GCM10017764_28590 [Sphingobacterium griseoflavum]
MFEPLASKAVGYDVAKYCTDVIQELIVFVTQKVPFKIHVSYGAAKYFQIYGITAS